MQEPVLQREVDVPKTRSSGGAVVVAVAFFALFTALGASAFVVRVRMAAVQGCPNDRAAARAVEAAERARLDAEVRTLDAEMRALEVEAARLDRDLAAVEPRVAGEPLAADAPGPVELISHEEAMRRASAQLSQAEREQVARFRAAAMATHDEVALAIWNDLPAGSQARTVHARERTALADEWLATQIGRLDRELTRRDCAAAEERLQRVRRLLPDRELPKHMAGCGDGL